MLLVDSSSCCSFAFHLHLMSVFSHSRHSLKGRKPSLFATQPVKTSSNFIVPSFLLWFARGSQVNTGAKVGFEVKPISTLQIFFLTDFFFFLFSPPPWFFFQGSLEEIQGILNTTEISLHQLTALVDCRSLHMVSKGGGGGGDAVHWYCREELFATDESWHLCSCVKPSLPLAQSTTPVTANNIRLHVCECLLSGWCWPTRRLSVRLSDKCSAAAPLRSAHMCGRPCLARSAFFSLNVHSVNPAAATAYYFMKLRASSEQNTKWVRGCAAHTKRRGSLCHDAAEWSDAFYFF